MARPFICPNCGEEMMLLYVDREIKIMRETDIYDVWECQVCPLKVLDWRS